jgi:hypothetical protein
VCGIIGVVVGLIPFLFFLAFILGVLALVFGFTGRGTAKRREGAGSGQAIAGVILGGVAVILGIVGVVILVAVINNTSDEITSSLTTPSTSSVTAPSNTYTVGQTAPSGDFRFTVFGFTDPQPSTNQFVTPDSGSHFVSVDVEVINPSSENRSFSSLLGFHLLDGENRQYDLDFSATTGLNPRAPDGQIPPNGSVRGFVGFQVPDGSTNLKFRAQGGVTASGAVWELS